MSKTSCPDESRFTFSELASPSGVTVDTPLASAVYTAAPMFSAIGSNSSGCEPNAGFGSKGSRFEVRDFMGIFGKERRTQAGLPASEKISFTNSTWRERKIITRGRSGNKHSQQQNKWPESGIHSYHRRAPPFF